MINWLFIVILCLSCFFVELLIYILILLIKALRIYIKKNSGNCTEITIKETKKKSKVGAFGVIIFNIVLVVSLITMSYIQRKNDIYNTENVIYCNREVAKFTELLDEYKLEYEVIGDNNVKLQNEQDFEEAKSIAQENQINFSTISLTHY